MAAPNPQAGMIVGRYSLHRLIGEGGMGSVWAATHTVTRKEVALKFIKSSVASDANMLRRFVREARAVSAVRHPNVVQVHDVVDFEGLPVMVMDLLEGESLGQKLARERIMGLPELARILCPVISAVGTAHAAGIVHRDLKPDNIFLVPLPNGKVEPKVLDFGIAKFSTTNPTAEQTANLTNTGAMLGTPCYMAPEQAFGEKDVNHLADIWALGIIIYECLAGARPVDGSNFGQVLKVIMTGAIVPLERVAPGLPSDIHRLVAHMLTLDRAKRCPDLHAPFEALSRYVDEKIPVSATFSKPKEYVVFSSEPGASLSTDPFAKTEFVSSGERTRSGVSLPVALGVGGALVVAVIGTTYLIRRSSTPEMTGEPLHTTFDVSSSTGPITGASSLPPPPTAIATSSASAPTASASAVAPPKGGRPPKHGAEITPVKTPETPTTTPPTPTPAATPIPVASAADQGRIHGVVVKPPF